MRAVWVCILALLLASTARAWTLVSTSPAVNATAATNGSTWIVLSPSCLTPVLGRGCNPDYAGGASCSENQRWTYTHTAAPGNPNATQCTFMLIKPEGEPACPVGLIATTQCQ